MLQASVAAFEDELPQLLAHHRGAWVAYRGATRLAFGDTKTALLQICYRQGYKDEELYVRFVEEPAPIHFSW